MVKLLHLLEMFPAALDLFQLPSLWAVIYLFLRLRKKIMKSKLSSALKPVTYQFPLRMLPATIRDALVANLYTNRLVPALPHHVMVKADKTWTYYQIPKPTCTSFCLEINLQAKTAVFNIGELEGAYNDRPVDADKTKRTLEKDKVIVKGYLVSRVGRQDVRYELPQENIEITFHPSQMVKVYPQVELSERDRQILFCYGSLRDGYLRRDALCRLDVGKPELESLVLRGLLKKSGHSHELTALSEANRLPIPKDNNVAVDQW